MIKTKKIILIILIISLFFIFIISSSFLVIKYLLSEKTSSFKEINNISSLKTQEKKEEIILESSMNFAIMPLNITNTSLSFYDSLKIEFNNKINKILVISTSNSNSSSINSFFINQSNEICSNNICLKTFNFNDNLKNQLSYENIPNSLSKHFEYLKNTFPNKEINFLLLNPSNFDTTIKNELLENFKDDAILFLNISDFSRIENAEYELLHNKKTYYTLNNQNEIEDYQEIEVECPSCLYLMKNLSLESWKYPHKFLKNNNYLYFDEIKNEDNWITINFMWDLIYDRYVSTRLNSKEEFDNFLKDFFENSDINLDPSKYKIRKWFWLDFLGANLETPVVYDKNECAYTQKEIAFCSKNDFLPWIKDMWFNIFSLANNHSLDWWVLAHQKTIENLDEVGINYAWYIRHGKYFEENYVSTWSIRGIKYAFHSYDFTISKYLMDTYCESLQEYKANWYNNFVASHWWSEYMTTHSETQEYYAHKLIDCWADVIIWHHPHVIQDIWWYKDKPIIYSLWNFVFDQSWSDNTQVWAEVLIDYNTNWKIKVSTLKRHVAVKR